MYFLTDMVKKAFLLLLIAQLIGCMFVKKPSAAELNALDHPPPAVQEKLQRLFPRALAWFNQVEAALLPHGRALTDAEQEIAKQLDVKQPQAVRIVVLATFPMPDDPELRVEAERHGLGSKEEGGRTMGNVIMLKPRFQHDATVLRHEFVHVSQQDRMGKENFLRRYVIELEMLGYARSPLELEAFSKQ